ncbi:MAG: ATP-binding cassette domain-containing protein [Rhodospirillales bacterium]|nr:ATP-binding cassette domain-containing protein [Rhodospirillales bacterium]
MAANNNPNDTATDTGEEKIPLGDARTWPLTKRLVREAVRPYGLHLGAAILCMAVVAAMTAAFAWLMEPVINKVFIEGDRSILWLLAAAVVGVFALKNAAAYAQEVLIGYVGQRVITDTQKRLFAHLMGADMALFQSRNSGALVSHFTYDTNAMRNAVSNAMVGLGRDSLSIIFLVGVMFYQEWLLTLITLVVAPLSAHYVDRLGRSMRRVSNQTQEEMGGFTSRLSESFQGIRMIKAYGLEAMEADKTASRVESIFRLTLHATKIRAAVIPIIDTLGGLAMGAVILYGGQRVIAGEMSAGAFFSFITAVGLAYQPIRALGKVNAYLQEGLAAAARVFAVLDRAPAIADPPSPQSLPWIPGAVRFEAVAFSYPNGTPALNGVDFEALPGGITALVGPSGAGKSTVLNLIPRFFDTTGGRVTVNGCDVRDVGVADLRGAMALVSQEVVLFDDTVLNNIRYGRWDADDDAIRAAACAAAADTFIRELPDGYATRVGEHGLRLSGGQRQRIAIARAILKDAPILLLDEATSALDTESERQIQAALERLMRGRTTIVIAHRLSTIRHADVIHVFDQGRVIESGTHDTLLARDDGLYAHLHALQFHDKSEQGARAE